MSEKLKQSLPKGFINRIQQQLGEEAVLFLKSQDLPAPVSVRLNKMKPTKIFQNREVIPWEKTGRYLPERPEFVFDPLIHAGAYYVQEASSMIFTNAIDFSGDLKILDLCAAPGGKSTLMLDKMSPNSLLLSNELVSNRADILQENLIKWGYPNSVVTSARPSELSKMRNYFDVVLVDAPCSGEGLFRKDPVSRNEWKANRSFTCSVTQRNILDEAVDLVATGGLLIYSTCTYSPEENEQIAYWFMKKHGRDFTASEMKFDPEWGIRTEILKHEEEVSQIVYKCFPHVLKGEGLFIAFFRKKRISKNELVPKMKSENNFRKADKMTASTLIDFISLPDNYNFYLHHNQVFVFPELHLNEINYLFEHFHPRKTGLFAGSFNMKNNDFVPSHEMAMSILLNPKFPSVDLPYELALKYLKKEDFEFPFPFINFNGWLIAKYSGIPLGWLKLNGRRLNNFYPKEWKIRKNLPALT